MASQRGGICCHATPRWPLAAKKKNLGVTAAEMPNTVADGSALHSNWASNQLFNLHVELQQICTSCRLSCHQRLSHNVYTCALFIHGPWIPTTSPSPLSLSFMHQWHGPGLEALAQAGPALCPQRSSSLRPPTNLTAAECGVQTASAIMPVHQCSSIPAIEQHHVLNLFTTNHTRQPHHPVRRRLWASWESR